MEHLRTGMDHSSTRLDTTARAGVKTGSAVYLAELAQLITTDPQVLSRCQMLVWAGPLNSLILL